MWISVDIYPVLYTIYAQNMSLCKSFTELDLKKRLTVYPLIHNAYYLYYYKKI